MSLLQTIFRTRRAPRGRRRQFTPTLDGLEARQLLDGGVQVSYIWNTSPETTTVGGHFAMQATQDNGLPYAAGTVANTTWTITGAYSGYTMDATSGYHPVPLRTVTVPGDTISAYWDEHPGEHTIGVTVQFVQPTWMGVPIVTQWPLTTATTLNINAPTVTTQTAFGTTNLVNTSYSTTLMAGNLATLTPGFHSNISVTTPNGAGGTFGVIQTLDPTLTYYKFEGGVANRYEGFTNPDQTDSGILLDKLSTSGFPYYRGTQSVGQTMIIDDTPQTTMNDPKTYSMVVRDNFTDTVMYTPPGGMPVPIATTSWGYGATIVRNSNGTPIFSPFTPKVNPGFIPGPTGQTGWSTGGSIPFPQWNGKTTDYLNYGTPILVKVPLALNDPLPDPGLAWYWPTLYDVYEDVGIG